MPISHQFVNTQDGSKKSVRRGFQISREKHKGTAFVNSSATGSTQLPVRPVPNKAAQASKSSSFRVRFGVPQNTAARGWTRIQQPSPGEEDTDGSSQSCDKSKAKTRRPSKTTASSGDHDPRLVCWKPKPKRTRGSPKGTTTTIYTSRQDGFNGAIPRSIAEWIVHGSHMAFTAADRRALWHYLDVVPRRSYSFEVLDIITHNPLRDQEVYQTLFSDSMVLQCALSLGATYDASNQQGSTTDLPLFAYHSSQLYSILSKMLGETPTPERQHILVQSMAMLAILAVCTSCPSDRPQC